MNLILNSNKWFSLITRHHPSRHHRLSNCRHCSHDDREKRDDLLSRELIQNERDFEELSAKQFESLAQTVDQMKSIEMIVSSYEYKKYTTQEVPSSLSLKDMRRLMDLKSIGQRNKYLRHLYEKEIKKIVNQRQKAIDKLIKERQLKEKWMNARTNRTGIFNDDGDIVYGMYRCFNEYIGNLCLRMNGQVFGTTVSSHGYHRNICADIQSIG